MNSDFITPTPTPPQLTMGYSQVSPTPLEMQSVLTKHTSEQFLTDSSTVLYTSMGVDATTIIPTQSAPMSTPSLSASLASATPSPNTVDIEMTTITPSQMQTIDVSLTVSIKEELESTSLVPMATVTMEPTPSMSSSMIAGSLSSLDAEMLSTYILSPSASVADEVSLSLLTSETSLIIEETISPTEHLTSPMATSSVDLTTPVGTSGTSPDVTIMPLISITEQTTLESEVTLSRNDTNITTVMPRGTTLDTRTTTSQVTDTKKPDVTTGKPSGYTTVSQTQQPSSEDNEIAVDLTITFDGDCKPVLQKEQDFKLNLISTFSELLMIDDDKIKVNDVKCGSVITDMTLYDGNDYDTSSDLLAEIENGNLTIVFDGRLLTAERISFKNGPLAEPNPTSGIDDDDDNGGTIFKKQQMLIYYLMGAVLGVVLVIVTIILMHHCVHRKCQTQQSFNISADGPVVKLSDFNMAHTYIPRPRSIYSENFHGADGKYSIYGFNSAHSSAYYSSDDDISKQCEEIPEAETVRRFSNEFGHSVPQWDLPRLEGKLFTQ